MIRKIRVAFIYKKSAITLSPKNHSTTIYNFFMKALKRNEKLDITYFPVEKEIDVNNFSKNFDVVLLFGNQPYLIPELLNIEKLDIPIICKAGDPHNDSTNAEIFHKKNKITHYFSFYPPKSFYKYFPSQFKYSTIVFGLESPLFHKITPFNERIKDRILNTGAIGLLNPYSRFIRHTLKKQYNRYQFYKLRTECTKLPYVEYITNKSHEFIRDKYPLLLQKYCAAIAATTVFPTIKYFEIPAAGCLTFMEITKENAGEYYGFKDGETAIFINNKNYKKKFEEYLGDLNNSKWQEIADNGRNYVLKNYNNDKGVELLIQLIEQYL